MEEAPKPPYIGFDRYDGHTILLRRGMMLHTDDFNDIGLGQFVLQHKGAIIDEMANQIQRNELSEVDFAHPASPAVLIARFAVSESVALSPTGLRSPMAFLNDEYELTRFYRPYWEAMHSRNFSPYGVVIDPEHEYSGVWLGVYPRMQ